MRIIEVLSTIATFAGAVGLPLLGLELIQMRRPGRLDRRRMSGMLTSAFCYVPAALVEAVLGVALVVLFIAVAEWAPWSLPITPATAVVALVLVDFTYYWEHRCAHEVHGLWAAYHSVHHSADHYDQTIGLRVSFVDIFVSPLFYLPLAAIGFHPLLVLTCLGVVLAWQQWLHTEMVGRLPLLDSWLNTPSNHRVHHGRNHRYLDKNYGGILIIWDRIFGTFEPESEPVAYGLVEPLTSRHPLHVHFHGLFKLFRQMRAAESWRTAMGMLWRKPRVRRVAAKSVLDSTSG